MRTNIDFIQNNIPIAWVTDERREFALYPNNIDGITISIDKINRNEEELSSLKKIQLCMLNTLKKINPDTSIYEDCLIIPRVDLVEILIDEIIKSLSKHNLIMKNKKHHYSKIISYAIIEAFALNIGVKLASIKNSFEENNFVASKNFNEILDEISSIFDAIKKNRGKADKLDMKSLRLLKKALKYEGKFEDAPTILLQIIDQLSLRMPLWMLDELKIDKGY